jgi:hypothetical protein
VKARETETKHSCSFRKTHKSKTKIVKVLVIVFALILLSGMAPGKRVEAHIIVSNYKFPYLAYHPESQVTLERFH